MRSAGVARQYTGTTGKIDNCQIGVFLAYDMLTSPDGHRRQAKTLAVLAGYSPGGGGWERRTVGPGAHGLREYDWAVVALDPTGLPDGWRHWLLVRRQTTPGPGKQYRELAFYRCVGPAATPLHELIRVAGAHWAIEECFHVAKNDAGLDHCQVRDYRAWYAIITLAMLAAAYLSATHAHTDPAPLPGEKGDVQPVSPARTG